MAIYLSSLLIALAVASAPEENLITNGDFEQGLVGWSELWTRSPGGTLALDLQERHGGAQAVRIEHPGQQDWSLGQLEAAGRNFPVVYVPFGLIE